MFLPPAIKSDTSPTGSVVAIRNGTPESDAFGRGLKARADADNGARMAKMAAAAALPPRSEQLAACAAQLDLAKVRADTRRFFEQRALARAVAS